MVKPEDVKPIRGDIKKTVVEDDHSPFHASIFSSQRISMRDVEQKFGMFVHNVGIYSFVKKRVYSRFVIK